MLKFYLSGILCLTLSGCMVWSGPLSPYRSQPQAPYKSYGSFKSSSSSSCSNTNGTFPVSGSCDAYIQCRNGVAEEQLCPDGLLFNEKSTGYPCSYPNEIECAQGKLQAAQPTDECPHQFGYYRIGDAKNCGQFKNCASGKAYIFDCPESLAYNQETYKCDWPDLVPDCDAEAFLGFKCPGAGSKNNKKNPVLGNEEVGFKFYADPQDCQYYFICVEGRPRRIGCGPEHAFNEELGLCDDLENVPKCKPGAKQPKNIHSQQHSQYNTKKPSSPYQKALSTTCPEPNGRFASPEQCDAYLECYDGIAEEKLCPDGLLFHQRTKATGDCTYAPLSICKERTLLQPANSTSECPRQFGFYSLNDAANCGQYRNCAHGKATISDCPEGLAFNIDSYQCDWPDLVEECNAEAYLGFNCPTEGVNPDNVLEVDAAPENGLNYFPHPDSCKKYFVCVNGHPRLYTCGLYLAFNPESKLCDFYTRVTECYKGRKD